MGGTLVYLFCRSMLNIEFYMLQNAKEIHACVSSRTTKQPQKNINRAWRWQAHPESIQMLKQSILQESIIVSVIKTKLYSFKTSPLCGYTLMLLQRAANISCLRACIRELTRVQIAATATVKSWWLHFSSKLYIYHPGKKYCFEHGHWPLYWLCDVICRHSDCANCYH